MEIDIAGKINCLLTDNGGEYMSREFNDYLKEKMISTQLTFPNTTQQNEVVERKNRHFEEICRSMLYSMSVPARFWAECTKIVVHITTT